MLRYVKFALLIDSANAIELMNAGELGLQIASPSAGAPRDRPEIPILELGAYVVLQLFDNKLLFVNNCFY
ncbi:MAG: hypothetical protein ACI9BW_001673 [Gammaproteobacteria bacterium]|jgi:hypothetical protein